MNPKLTMFDKSDALRKKIADSVAELIGYNPNMHDHPVTTIEMMMNAGNLSGSVGYASTKLGNCYWEYKSLVFGDAEMPMTNGGRAYAHTDIEQHPLFQTRVRVTTYRIDSSD